ncbi:unnamed protein product [Paramecium octaurelia]|uniref:Uncharacterized protein n=1 Tax=Paramecium octaurelia TaxID=43137 RepID=A0A8S1YA12_PAROT|nr:unnamed protein product [Paramecium octaurelia]
MFGTFVYQSISRETNSRRYAWEESLLLFDKKNRVLKKICQNSSYMNHLQIRKLQLIAGNIVQLEILSRSQEEDQQKFSSGKNYAFYNDQESNTREIMVKGQSSPLPYMNMLAKLKDNQKNFGQEQKRVKANKLYVKFLSKTVAKQLLQILLKQCFTGQKISGDYS